MSKVKKGCFLWQIGINGLSYSPLNRKLAPE